MRQQYRQQNKLIRAGTERPAQRECAAGRFDSEEEAGGCHIGLVHVLDRQLGVGGEVDHHVDVAATIAVL